MDLSDIRQFIPQRDPFIMVDRIVRIAGEEAVTGLAVRDSLYFVDEAGELDEPGLIEHIAQSASAFAGYKALSEGAATAPVGYIGEVRKFRCYRRARRGEELFTTVIMGPEAAGVRLIDGQTCSGGGVIAETKMKIFIRQPDA